MFPPNNSQQRSKTAILFIVMIAVLAHMCSLQLAHGAEHFLSNDSVGRAVALRAEAVVVGDEIRLRQIARWSDADKSVLDPIGELVITHFEKGKAVRAIALNEVQSLLTDAGVNVATINFTGPMACQVTRSDAEFAPGAALEQITAAKTSQPTEVVAQSPDSPFLSLRSILTTNLAQKLKIPEEDLQITFRGQDEASLRLCEPHFHFDVDPIRTANLGDVSWAVTVSGGNGLKRMNISANARAWRKQQVVARALASRQTITEQDVVEKRSLVDTIPSDVTLDRNQVINQAAARDLKAGTVVTAHLVDPVQMVKGGQYVSVQSALGGITVKSVARALEGGTFGQSIRMRNEGTKETFTAIITGPQQACLSAPETATASAMN